LWGSEIDEYYAVIKRQYLNKSTDSAALFRTVQSVATHVGWDRALSYLEQCVTEKRLAWLAQHLKEFERTDDPVWDGYRLFYEVYLGVVAPVDGTIVARTETKMVTRWWNHCPTLEACQRLGLDTRQVCRKAYHGSVQAFLTRLDPRLKFERNYKAIRPHCAYCEESISLEEPA
jgi:hypothetical protein